jgi:succinate-acetate transporter protein
VLRPVAVPTLLGLFGLFAATLMVGSHLAGWWGNAGSPLVLFPFVLIFGGVAQFLAGMWAYTARDGLATVVHGTWGAFWFAWGLYQLFVVTGNLPLVVGPSFEALGFWFIPLAMITLTCTAAALGRGLGLTAVLACLMVASTLAAAGYISGTSWPETTAGWLFVFAAAFAWYTASAMLLESSHRRTILPTFRWSRQADLPGGQDDVYPVEYSGLRPGAGVHR